MVHDIVSSVSAGSFLALGMPGGAEWIMIAALGLLIFGKRLPEVGRSLGKGIVEFKKGLKGVEDEVEEASNKPSPSKIEHKQEQQAYKFDPHTGKPVDQTASRDEEMAHKG